MTALGISLGALEIGPPRHRHRPVVLEGVDEARLERLLHEHFDTVWRTARRLGLAPLQADDVAQEVYIIAAQRLADILPGRERSYLVSVTLRVVSNLGRLRATQREVAMDDLETADPVPNAEELLEEKRRRELLQRALNALAPELRVVFVLYELEGLSGREMAEALGLPKGTIMSRLRRARERFLARMRCLLADQRRPA